MAPYYFLFMTSLLRSTTKIKSAQNIFYLTYHHIPATVSLIHKVRQQTLHVLHCHATMSLIRMCR